MGFGECAEHHCAPKVRETCRSAVRRPRIGTVDTGMSMVTRVAGSPASCAATSSNRPGSGTEPTALGVQSGEPPFALSRNDP